MGISWKCAMKSNVAEWFGTKKFRLLIDLCAGFTQRIASATNGFHFLFHTNFFWRGKTKAAWDRRTKEEQDRLWFVRWNLCTLERNVQSEIIPEHYYPTILARMLKNTRNAFLWMPYSHKRHDVLELRSERTARKEGKNFGISSWSGSIIIYPVRRHNKIGEWWWICTTICSYTCVVCLVTQSGWHCRCFPIFHIL